MWKDTHPATQFHQAYQSPRFVNEEWFTGEDIRKEVEFKTGRKINSVVMGRIAKEHNLVKDTGLGFKVYHKKLVDVLVEYVNHYYGD